MISVLLELNLNSKILKKVGEAIQFKKDRFPSPYNVARLSRYKILKNKHDKNHMGDKND